MTGSSTAGAASTGADRTAAPHGSRVADLRPREAMVFDQARLVEVCDRHGTGAEAYIAGTLDAVEALIADAAAHPHDDAALARGCAEIMVLSEAIGMVTMRQAAGAILECLDRGPRDGTGARTARMACLQRLLRLGRPGGTGGWNLADAPEPDPAA